jgi:hypothetical protein
LKKQKRKIEDPAETPAEAYHFWHRRWCEILTENHRREILEAGLAGRSFTERVPDAPDGSGFFSYAFADDGGVGFIEGEGEAIAEYDSYELGFRMLSDERIDAEKQLGEGRFRLLSKPEQWIALLQILPILRRACRIAVEEAEEEFALELPKYW